MDQQLQSLVVMLIATQNKSDNSVILLLFGMLLCYYFWQKLPWKLFSKSKGQSITFVTRYLQNTWEMSLSVNNDMRALTYAFMSGKHSKQSEGMQCRKEEVRSRYNNTAENVMLLDPGEYRLRDPPLCLSVHRTESDKIKDSVFVEHVYCLSSYVWGIEELTKWVSTIVREYDTKILTCNGTKLFCFTFKEVQTNGNQPPTFHFEQQELHSLTSANFETFDFIVSPHKQKIVALLDRLNDKEWYRVHGERRKQGFAFTGKSGTGKTKIAVAMSLYLNRHVVIVDCKRIEKIEHLETILNKDKIGNIDVTHENLLYLFEEFSMKVFDDKQKIVLNASASTSTCSKVEEKTTTSLSPSVREGLDINAFLSILDGPRKCDGLLFVATTNEEKLDPRIVRDGRLTLFQFEFPTVIELQDFFHLHFPSERVPLELLKKKLEINTTFSYASAMTLVKQASNMETLLSLLETQ
jgi:AAA+ superfamily predicted ATPase